MSRPVVRNRVASSDWCASRNVVSVTPTAFESRIQRANPSGPSSVSRCLDPLGGGDDRSTVGQLVVRIDRRRSRPVRLVHRDIGEVVEDLGAAVGRGVRGQQVRTVVDERRRDPAGAEIRIVDDRQQERDVRRHPADAELGQRATRPGDRRREVAPAARQLDQHRVEVRADLGAQMRCAVESDARTARRPVAGDAAGVGTESVGGILGGDPALHRGTPVRQSRPGSARDRPALSPSAMRIWLATRSTSVISSVTVCSTWMRGFISMKT